MPRSLAVLALVWLASGCASVDVNPFSEEQPWDKWGAIAGGPFDGNQVYLATFSVIEPDTIHPFEWGGSLMHVPEPVGSRLDGDSWAVLHFAKNWTLFDVLGGHVQWKTGAAYLRGFDNEKAPGMATYANFHLGIVWAWDRIRIAIIHHSNGDLEKRKCDFLPDGTRFCLGDRNSGNNFLQIQIRF